MTVNHNLKFSDKLEDSIEYLNSVCNSWNLEDSKNNVALYSYHDGVDWKGHYAVAVDGTVKSLLKNVSYTEAYNSFKVVVDCFY